MDESMLVTEVDPYYFHDAPWEPRYWPSREECKDLIVTWPKTRSLESYLTELDRALSLGQAINFRVSRLPSDVGFLDWMERPHRCYMVHDGAVRGYNNIIGLDHIGDNKVFDPVSGKALAAGNYIMRDPLWHPVEERKMHGFQGWRYYSYK